MSSLILWAPWTDVEVHNLNKWQSHRGFHPFTCAERSGHPVRGRDFGVLYATKSGWICFDCDYRQEWAHDFMAVAPKSVVPLFDVIANGEEEEQG